MFIVLRLVEVTEGMFDYKAKIAHRNDVRPLS